MRGLSILRGLGLLVGCTHEPLSEGLPVQNHHWGDHPIFRAPQGVASVHVLRCIHTPAGTRRKYQEMP